MLIGADPELFLQDGNRFISAYGIIPGTKHEPFKVEKGAVQVDGMACEFNIDPVEDEDSFVININEVLRQLKGMIPNGIELSNSSVSLFTPEYMSIQPDEAKVLGCDPDFNAYSGSDNPQPEQHPIMRTAAGHVHVGFRQTENAYEIKHFVMSCEITKQLDFMLGIPSIVLDEEDKRREMYGKAGAFRPKPYGMEYRVLSNFWLKDERLMRWVFKTTKQAVDMMYSQDIMFLKYGELARDIIDNNNRDAAKEWLKNENYQLPL